MGYYENQEADYYMGHPPEAEGEESTGEPETQKIIKEWKCLLGLCPAFDCPNVGGTFSGICSVYADSPLYNCEDDERTQIQIEFIEKLLQAQAKQIRMEKQELIDAMKWFCGRVENGEVRSKNTYARFKELIQKNS